MEKKPKSQNKKKTKLNFNFSFDDSEDDDFQSQNFKHNDIKTRILKEGCTQSKVQCSIPANDASGKENISPSIHIAKFEKSVNSTSLQPAFESEGKLENKNERDIHYSRGKITNSIDFDGFEEVEVQDCSIQTSLCHDESISRDDEQGILSSKDDNAKSVKTSNSSTFSDQNSSSSSVCSQKDHFTTAIEHSSTSINNLSSNSDTGKYLSPGKSSPSSQELSSYYVKDTSIQTSLSQSFMNSTSNNISSHSKLKSPKSQTSPLSSPSIDPSVQLIDHKRTPGEQVSRTVFGFIDENSSIVEDQNDVLAPDSDTEDVNSTTTNMLNNFKYSVVIADSENDDENGNDNVSDILHIEEDNFSNNSFNNCEKSKDQHGQQENSDLQLQDSGALCLRWNPSQDDSNASSFTKGEYRSQRRRDSSSSDDGHFDDFLNKMKADQEERRSVENKDVPSMDEFIVNDNDSLPSEAESDDSNNNSTDDENNDDYLFYIKTNNKLDRTEREARRKPEEKTYVYYNSSSSESNHESDLDLSDFIENDENPQQETRKKRLDLAQSTNNEENERSNESSVESPGFVKTISTGWSEEGIDIDTKKKVNKTGRKLNLLTPKQTHLVTPSKSKVPGKKDKGEVEACPSGKKKLLAKSFIPSWSSSGSDDDFVVKEKDTPSRFPPVSPKMTSFKTPKPASKSTSQFETPINRKGPQTHPWTAPKGFNHPSRSNFEDDDNTFFLKSLSANFVEYRRHPEAARFVKSFKSLKEELTKKLFVVFNETVFESKIPASIELEWSARYRKTAGTFSYKRSNPNMAKITLSVKVCDRPERVRDTLAHELCHAAVRIINGVNESHGPVWKSWARKVNAAFPFMPVVARCHDYIIHSKYTYQCVNCKYRIARHSKSLDTEKKVCGHCKGDFQVFLTSELNSSSFDSSAAATPKTPRTPNKFAMFVKECYSEVKKRNSDFKHGDIMKELSKEFAEKNKIQ